MKEKLSWESVPNVYPLRCRVIALTELQRTLYGLNTVARRFGNHLNSVSFLSRSKRYHRQDVNGRSGDKRGNFQYHFAFSIQQKQAAPLSCPWPRRTVISAPRIRHIRKPPVRYRKYCKPESTVSDGRSLPRTFRTCHILECKSWNRVRSGYSCNLSSPCKAAGKYGEGASGPDRAPRLSRRSDPL